MALLEWSWFQVEDNSLRHTVRTVDKSVEKSRVTLM